MSPFRLLVGLLVTATVMASVGCGRSSPTTPPGPGELLPHFAAGTALMFTSGEDSRPVQGAVVRVSGESPAGAFDQTFVSDGAGRIRLDRPVLHLPVPAMDVTAPGFLLRETTLRPESPETFTLWPASSPTGLNEAFTGLIVYSTPRCPTRLDPGHIRRQDSTLQRMNIVLDSTLQSESYTSLHAQAAEIVNAVTKGKPVYTVTSVPPTTDNTIDVSLQPGDSTCQSGTIGGFAIVRYRDGHISGARVVYCSAAVAGNLRSIVHELGHTLGFLHSDGTADVMSCTFPGATSFSPREALALRLMHQRPVGNEFPDRDRPRFPSGTSIASAPSEQVFLCPRSP